MSGIGILGAGSWGTALAIHLARAGRNVRLWARDPQLAATMIASGSNPRYLDGIRLTPGIHPTSSVEVAVDDAQFVVVAVPSHGVRDVVRVAAASLAPHAVIVSATKGLEVDSFQRMSQVIEEELHARFPVVVLSGPTFASEIAAGLPAAVLAASTDARAGAAVQEQFRGRGMRLYASTHHARSCRDLPPRLCRGGAARNACRPERSRRSRVDVYGRSEPEPPCRARARERSTPA
jgi:glycerol-3-phosphate dehydrogenase (NAD(P)+)